MTTTELLSRAPAPKVPTAPGLPATSAHPLPELLPADRRRSPGVPGPLAIPHSGWRARVSRAMAVVDRLCDRLPPCRWLHARAQAAMQIHVVDIPLRRGGPGLDGLKIAFLSDLHAGSCLDEQGLAAVFARVMAQAPDLICFGGDLINTRPREIELFRAPLAQLRAPLGVFAVPGNHDHFYGGELAPWVATLEACGVRVLRNQGVRIECAGSWLWLAGVDDLTEATSDLAASLQGWNQRDPVVLLSHHPDFFFEAAAAGIDLTLSGHTHGGQVLIFGKTPFKHSRFGWWRGRIVEGDAQLYVSRGVGVTFLPIRLGAPAEVPVLRLRTGH